MRPKTRRPRRRTTAKRRNGGWPVRVASPPLLLLLLLPCCLSSVHVRCLLAARLSASARGWVCFDRRIAPVFRSSALSTPRTCGAVPARAPHARQPRHTRLASPASFCFALRLRSTCLRCFPMARSLRAHLLDVRRPLSLGCHHTWDPRRCLISPFTLLVVARPHSSLHNNARTLVTTRAHRSLVGCFCCSVRYVPHRILRNT